MLYTSYIWAALRSGRIFQGTRNRPGSLFIHLAETLGVLVKCSDMNHQPCEVVLQSKTKVSSDLAVINNRC